MREACINTLGCSCCEGQTQDARRARFHGTGNKRQKLRRNLRLLYWEELCVNPADFKLTGRKEKRISFSYTDSVKMAFTLRASCVKHWKQSAREERVWQGKKSELKFFGNL